jgi:hypothetical protein
VNRGVVRVSFETNLVGQAAYRPTNFADRTEGRSLQPVFTGCKQSGLPEADRQPARFHMNFNVAFLNFCLKLLLEPVHQRP